MNRFDHLLVDCLRNDPVSRAWVEGVKGLPDADWMEVFRRTVMHGITPFVYRRLRALPVSPAIPEKAFEKLRQSYLAQAAENTAVYHHLGKVADLFDREGIPMIVLKGAYLAEAVYGDIALRPMNDIDLCIREADLAGAEQALFRLGFSPTSLHRVVSEDCYHFTYSSGDGRCFVELHWRFLEPSFPFHLDMAGFWLRSKQAVIGRRRVGILGEEDLVVYLCLHACKDSFVHGLRSLLDVHLTLERFCDQLDWGLILDLVRKCRTGKCLYLTLRIVRDLLGSRIPDEVLAGLRPVNFEDGFLDLALEQIFSPKDQGSMGLVFSPNIARLWQRSGVRAKLALIAQRLFPSSEAMREWYPIPKGSAWIYWYYPKRLLDLAWKYRATLRRLLRDPKGFRKAARWRNESTSLKDWLMTV